MYRDFTDEPIDRAPNTYSSEHDEPIGFPVAEALELCDRICRSKTDNEIITALLLAKAHAKISDAENQRLFEMSGIRKTFLGLNFAANCRGIYAPVFREQLRPAIRPTKKGPKPLPKIIDAIYSLDRQLIDLHWFYCREIERGISSSPKIAGEYIWENREINPDAAEGFIQTTWQAGKKTSALHITEQDQLGLGVLRSKKISDLHYDVLKKQDSDITRIKGYCTNSTQLTVEDAQSFYDDLKALRLARQDVAEATRLRQLMEIDVSDQRSLESRKRLMRRRRDLFKTQLRLLN